MVQMIKKLWEKWQELERWQQICLLIPFIALTVLLLFYIICPVKSKRLEKEILELNKERVDEKVEVLEKKDEVLEKKQNKIEEKRKEVEKKVEKRENETAAKIKEIDDASGDFDKLLAIQRRLNSRSRARRDSK